MRLNGAGRGQRVWCVKGEGWDEYLGRSRGRGLRCQDQRRRLVWGPRPSSKALAGWFHCLQSQWLVQQHHQGWAGTAPPVAPVLADSVSCAGFLGQAFPGPGRGDRRPGQPG